jgi:acyl-CoA thioesterase
VVIAAITDAWPPAVFSRLEVPVGVPTIDLTIHFRQTPSGEPGWTLVRFRTQVAAAGYLEEDGEVWSADGRLLAQSRQLAVVLAPG